MFSKFKKLKKNYYYQDFQDSLVLFRIKFEYYSVVKCLNVILHIF